MTTNTLSMKLNNLQSFSFQVVLTTLLASILVLISCGDDQFIVEPEAGQDHDYEVIISHVDSEEHSFRVVRILSDLHFPWAVAWLPGGNMLITERSGRLLLSDGHQTSEVSGLPEIRSQGQAGLLDVVVHPDYENNGWIYFTYVSPDDGNVSLTLARAKLDGYSLNEMEILYKESPSKRADRHYGSRIVFPGDGTVMFTIGDRGQRDPSQDLSDPAGSTLRLNDDGSIPSDNPFYGSDTESILPEIYSYGHRNAQGMAVHPSTGAVWQHEHGPRGGDALNVIRPGANYGWPVATYGRNYGTMTRIGIEPHEDPDIQNPVTYWAPTSIAPSGMAFYEGNVFENWNGNLFMAALADRHVRRLVLDGEEVVHQEVLLEGELGRIRDVRTGPDGFIYLLTDHSNGALYRLESIGN